MCKINLRLNFLCFVMLYLEHIPLFSNLRDGFFFLLLSPKVHDRYESFHNLKGKTKKKVHWCEIFQLTNLETCFGI